LGAYQHPVMLATRTNLLQPSRACWHALSL